MLAQTPCSPVDRGILFAGVERLIGACLDEAGQAQGDLGMVQDAVDSATREIGARVMQAAVTESMSEVILWKCPECGKLLGYHDTQTKQLVTPMGVVSYTRARYHCAGCDKDVVPVDIANDLEHTGVSLQARERVVEEATQDAYARVSEGVKPQVDVGRQTVARIVEEAAQWRKEEEEGAIQGLLGNRDRPGGMPVGEAVALASTWKEKELPQGAVLCLSADGGKYRTPEKGEDGRLQFKEGRVGTVSVVHQGEQMPRQKAGGKLYLAGMLTAEQIMELLLVAVMCLPSGLQKLKIVFVADGGPWWEWLKAHFPNAIGILDMFHAAEHMLKVALLLYGEGSAQAKQWRSQIYDWLKTPGKADELLEQLKRRLAEMGEAATEEMRTETRRLAAYLEEHRDHMRYWEYEASGYPLGSGGIESAINQVLTMRLKGPGMKWTPEHGGDMLRLRAAMLSGELPALFRRRQEACLKLRDRFLEPLPRAA